MILSTLRDEVRWATKTDTASFTDAQLDSRINVAVGELVQDIIRVQTTRNSTGDNIRYDLISTQGLSEGAIGYNGEYPFPSDLLRPIRVSVSFDGLTWKPCQVYDIAENTNSEYDQTDINNTFLLGDSLAINPSTAQPFVRFIRDSFFIRPLNTGSTITNGLIIWYEKRQDVLTGDAEEPPFESNYHDLVVLKVAMSYGRRYPEKFNPMWKTEYDELHASFVEFYKNRFKSNMTLKPNQERFK